MKSELDIFDTIKSTGLDLLKDYGDKGLSEIAKIFDKELLSDVPYVGTIINLATFGTKVKGYFMAKKLFSFLSQLHSIPLEERQKFIQKLENSKESKKIGEKLIILIDSLDDDDKAVMLGKFFKKTMEGKIDMDTFNRLAIGIKNIYFADLEIFIGWHSQSVYNLHDDINSSLYQNGFLLLSVEDVKRQNLKNINTNGTHIVQPKLKFQISELGYVFLNNIGDV